MPRFKSYSYQQAKIIPLSLEQQIEQVNVPNVQSR